jgi:phospholipid/cholesterol/gamma-HCH transport system permease protein
MADEGWIQATPAGGTWAIAAGGRWLVTAAPELDRSLSTLERSIAPRIAGASPVRIDCTAIEALDTVGAWLLLRLKAALARREAEVSIDNLAPRFAPLLAQAEKYRPDTRAPGRPPADTPVDALADLGAWTIAQGREAITGIGFLGLVVVTAVRAMLRPGRIRFIALANQIQRTGPSALPIVGLLSFLVGVVFAYQGAVQLKQFGAEIYTVNLIGVSFLRELGGLLSAIIVAGRSGSAFTAEIGTMQVNEEIDAMTTIGLDPIEVLVLPRVTALVLTLPLMTFYADAMGLIGGAFICDLNLGIPLPLYLQQLKGAVSGTQLWLGVVKAPFFAAVIALVGCREGLRVSRNAESVGRRTTLSVVQSIFLVIVLDAFFSIIFAQFDL